MNETAHFEVAILGGGLAGLLQARHLVRNLPGISVAIIEPRTDEEIASISKIGESTVEIAASFMTRELGLIDYFIDNHPPKCGLNFHWPKDTAQTGGMDDYFSIWSLRFPKVASFQMHRGKLERDLTKMNEDAGITFLRGRAREFELGEPGGQSTIQVRLKDRSKLTVTCDHLVDAAGRAFLTGRKLDNIRRGPEHLHGLDTITSWVRVSGVDRSIFGEGADPTKTSTSQWYATNHFFGHGHWVWMIPIDQETRTVSFGLVAHRDVIEPRTVNTEARLMSFLRANHDLLGKLIDSGKTEDFICWDRPSHLCDQLFGESPWYAIGDAAYFGDPFYSTGTSTIAMAVTSVTQIVRARREGWADAEERRRVLNDVNLMFAKGVAIHLFRDHPRHMGNASVMSWRIYLEYMWWFGMWVPSFIGKWHLDLEFGRAMIENDERPFFADVYEQFTELTNRGKSIGFMDPYRADQLALSYCPTCDPDHYLENLELDGQRLDVMRSLARCYRFTSLWVLKFLWTGFGWEMFSKKKLLKHAVRMFFKSFYVSMGSWRHRVRSIGRPRSVAFAELTAQFRSYVFKPKLQDWSGKDDDAERRSA